MSASVSVTAAASVVGMPDGFRALERVSLAVAGIGLAGSLWGYLDNPARFAQSWLMGWLFWFGIAAGSLGWLQIHHLVQGRWSAVIQRPLEAAALKLPMLMLLYAPLFFCLDSLYPWLRPEVLAGDALVQHKQTYLNLPAFASRFALYAVIWVGLALSLRHLARRLEQATVQAEQDRLHARIKRIAAPGLLLFVLACTFAAFDWLMSLEPRWYSTIYGALQVVGHGLSSLLFMAIVLHLLARHPPLADTVEARQFHDIGNLILGFVLLWAYMSFGQFLIIWSGNLHEETFWFLKRAEGGWLEVSWALFIGHVLLPFFLLLFRRNKLSPKGLAAIALGVLLFRCLDVYWQVAPAFRAEAASIYWTDMAAVVAIGGLFLHGFPRQCIAR